MEKVTRTLQGMYRDILQGADGQVLYDSGWRSNTIVDSCYTLLASFIAGQDNVQGIQSLAVGEGSPSWDKTVGLLVVESNVTQLEKKYNPPLTLGSDELKLVYLDPNDKPVELPTRCLQITATLPKGYPQPSAGSSSKTYPLREFGLFGRLGGQEYMINCVRHPVIHKDGESTLIRTLRLRF